jgi:hypothetical protein
MSAAIVTSLSADTGQDLPVRLLLIGGRSSRGVSGPVAAGLLDSNREPGGSWGGAKASPVESAGRAR